MVTSMCLSPPIPWMPSLLLPLLSQFLYKTEHTAKLVSCIVVSYVITSEFCSNTHDCRTYRLEYGVYIIIRVFCVR
jgi:hypothetical protein